MWSYIQTVADTITGLPAIQQFLVGVAVSLVLAKGIEFAGMRVVRALIKASRTDLDDIIFEELHTPLYTTIAFAGIYWSTFPLQLGDTFYYTTQGIVFTFLTILWTIGLIRTGKRFCSSAGNIKGLDKTFMPVFENVWTLTIIIGSLFMFLQIWGISITPFLASAGVAGIAIGFAAKDAVANFFGGIALYFDDTYKVGDFVMLDSGEAGSVVDVGIRSTTLRTRDDVTITVPNAVLNSAKVTNESIPYGKRRIDVPIGVAYGTDIDRLEELLETIAVENDSVREQPEPRTRFRQFGDSALNYELQCWIDDPVNKPGVVHELNREIYKTLDEEGIEIPFPQRTVHMDD